ncbi:hypothetical protein FJZ53_07160 [Candidatus Woesearchaeota archaeon]|nr:hypothetical protein [Candidatus Woesearchaeota archaeon]
MKLYLTSLNDEYRLYADETKSTVKSKLERRISNMKDGKVKSTLEKYVDKLESDEELVLKTVYHFESLEVAYSSKITEEEAKKKCKSLADKYFQKNITPLILYGVLCPVSFVAAPFIPVLNWGFTLLLGYKFLTKYQTIKGYDKVLKSAFIKEDNLESKVKTS